MTKSSVFDRNVQLVKAPHGLIMLPSRFDADAAIDEGFPIPGFPLSQFAFLETMARSFWEEHRRCLAVVLMVDAVSQRWVRPEIPTQRCHEQGVAWSYEPGDFSDRPSHILIGGSYQLSKARSIDEIMASVPASDGVHFVRAHQDGECLAYLMVTIGGEVQMIPPNQILVDDWAAMILAHRDRIKII